MKATLREGDVVAAGTEWVLREDAGQLVPLDPLQGRITILEHTGCESRALAVEDPDMRQADLGASAVLAHVGNRI